MFRAPIFTLITTLLVAQAPGPVAAHAPGAAPVSQMPSPLQAAPRPDAIIARVAGQVIKQADFDEYLERATNPHQREHMDPLSAEMENLRKKFLDMTVLIAKARKDGLDKTPDFRKRLELTKTQLLLEGLLKQVGTDLEKEAILSDAELKADYEAHKEQYRLPQSFSARQILVSVKGATGVGANGLPEEEAKAKALQAAKALASGKSWNEVAKAYSDDPGSRERGGLYENITFGSFVPEFEGAVRKQEAGKVGEPVKSEFGFHVIQVEKIVPSKLPSFEEVKDRLKSKAVDGKRKELFMAYLDGIKKEMGFEAFLPEVKPSQATVIKSENK